MRKLQAFFESLRDTTLIFTLISWSPVIYELSRTGQWDLSLGTEASCFSGTSGARFMCLFFASEEYRVKQVMATHGLSEKAAEKMIAKSDSERRGFMRFAFQNGFRRHVSLRPGHQPRKSWASKEPVGSFWKPLKAQAVKECSFDRARNHGANGLLKKSSGALLKEHFGTAQFSVDVPERVLYTF